MENAARMIITQPRVMVPFTILLVVLMAAYAPSLLALAAAVAWWARRRRRRMELNAYTARVIMEKFPVRKS